MWNSRFTSPPLFRDDRRKTPLGAFVVEQVVPESAKLVGETSRYELRDINKWTVRSERNRAAGTGIGLDAIAGPSFNVFDPGVADFDLRLQGGGVFRYQFAKLRTTGLGGSGISKIVGQLKHQNTALYLVKKSVYVRLSGDSGTPMRFHTWSLDRMSSSEARRLAGWDDGMTVRPRPGLRPPSPRPTSPRTSLGTWACSGSWTSPSRTAEGPSTRGTARAAPCWRRSPTRW